MIIRPAEARDHPGIREVLLAAFPRPGEADLVETLRSEGHSAIELVADDDGEVVGHALFSPMEAPFRALALGPLAVAPERHRQGIGTRLVEAGHAIAREQGWDAIFLLGDPAYYQRFGYELALAAGFSSPYSGPHFLALALRGSLPVTGGTVHYAPAFAALD